MATTVAATKYADDLFSDGGPGWFEEYEIVKCDDQWAVISHNDCLLTKPGATIGTYALYADAFARVCNELAWMPWALVDIGAHYNEKWFRAC